MIIYLIPTKTNSLTAHKIKANNKKNIAASLAKTNLDYPHCTQPLILSEKTPEITSVSNYVLKFNIINY